MVIGIPGQLLGHRFRCVALVESLPRKFRRFLHSELELFQRGSPPTSRRNRISRKVSREACLIFHHIPQTVTRKYHELVDLRPQLQGGGGGLVGHELSVYFVLFVAQRP